MRQNIAGWNQQKFCFQKFVDNAQLCFAFTPQENFPAHNFIFTEGDGDGIQSRLPFKFLYFITAISNFSCQNFLNGEFLEVQKLI